MKIHLLPIFAFATLLMVGPVQANDREDTSRDSATTGVTIESSEDQNRRWTERFMRVRLSPDVGRPQNVWISHREQEGWMETDYSFENNRVLRVKIPREGDWQVYIGGETPSPIDENPELRFLTNIENPLIRLQKPAGGELFRPGQSITIRWAAQEEYLASQPVSLSVSRDGGSSWNTLANNRSGSGTYTWTPEETGNFHFRATVENEMGYSGHDRTDEPIRVRRNVPGLTITGPSQSSHPRIPLQFSIDDGYEEQIQSLNVYTTYNQGETWTLYGRGFDPESPLHLLSRDGRIGVFLQTVGTDGATFPRPQSGDSPVHTVRVDTTPPDLSLKTLEQGKEIEAGSVELLCWNYYERNPVEQGITIHISRDGGETWNVLEESFPSKDDYDWIVPDDASGSYHLRVTAEDAFGNTSQVTTGELQVTSE